MTTFQTPEHIAAVIEIAAGDINVTASDRSDSVVTLRPRDEARHADIQAAASALIEFTNGILNVKTVKTPKRFTGPNKNDGSVIVDVELPTGSSLAATTGMGLVRCEGELADTAVKTGMGDVRLDRVGSLKARSGFGDVVVDVANDSKVSTGGGVVRLGSIKGLATVKNSLGDVSVARCDRDINIRTSSGNITIDRALASVTAVSAAGDITLSDVSVGSVTARTSAGAIAIGVREGAAAWLEVASKYGSVRNGLTASPGPSESDTTVEVRARTGAGDVTINRASAA